MKKMIIATLIITTMLTGCGKEERVNTFESETAVAETVQTELKEAETKVSSEYLAELEYNSQTNGF